MTMFRVASSQEDYAQCDKLLQKTGNPRIIMGFPTIMAMKGDELVGFLSTRIEKKLIIAGPLTMAPGQRRIFTALKLCEAYELAMLNLGITRFIFGAAAGSLLDKGIKRYYPSMQPYAMRDGYSYYVWSIDNGRRRSEGPGADAGRASATGGTS